MEIIELLACTGCGRIVDQWTMFPKCKRCDTKTFKTVGPSLFVLLCWAANEPKHVLKLVLQDIKEKLHAKER